MSTTTQLQENKMGTMDIRPLLVQVSLPIAFSMMVEAFYNVVDSIFVAQISESAFTALSLAFPFQNLMIAVGVGTGVGINALLSRSLGEKNTEMANKAANNGILLGFLSYLAFAFLAFFGAPAFMNAQTNNQEIIAYGVTYIRIVGVGSIGIFTQIIFEKLLQSTGKTNYILLTQGLGAVINIILDPIMIFGYFGFPKMGVAGAALATIIGQIIGGITAIYLNNRFNNEIRIRVRGFKPDKAVIGQIYRVGLPSIIMTSISSVMIFFFNKILLVHSESAAAVLGAYFKLQSFIFMPVFGFTSGVIPIVAYNYGAQNRQRLVSAHKWCLFYVTAIMTTGFLIFQLFAKQILGFFDLSPVTVTMGISALRIISINFVFAGFIITASALFQALGDGLLSMFMSISRQLLVLLPLAYLFTNYIGVHAAWWAIPIAEICALMLCLVFLHRVYKKQINLIPLPATD